MVWLLHMCQNLFQKQHILSETRRRYARENNWRKYFHTILIKGEWSFLQRKFIDLQIETFALNYLPFLKRQWR